MTVQSGNEEHQQWLRSKIVEMARSILSGEVGIVASAGKLYWGSCEIGAERDPDIMFFTGVYSETDEFLIVGEARKHWNPEALRANDAKLAAYEARIREEAFAHCRRLIEKYDHDANEKR